MPHKWSAISELLTQIIQQCPLFVGAMRQAAGSDSVLQKLAVALVVPLATAIITAGATAYVTQAVMAEQIRSLRVELDRQRTENDAAHVRLNDDVRRVENNSTSADAEFRRWQLEHERQAAAGRVR